MEKHTVGPVEYPVIKQFLSICNTLMFSLYDIIILVLNDDCSNSAFILNCVGSSIKRKYSYDTTAVEEIMRQIG